MRDEYDFSKGVRVAFPDAAAVNEALRQVLRDRKKRSGAT